MNSKIARWCMAIISGILILVALFVFVKDLGFFITKEKANAKINSIQKPYNYKIILTYYNIYKQSEVTATVKLESSYKEKIERMGGETSIYYSKMFSKDVYIIDCKVPTKGILVFEIILIVIFCIAFKYGVEGIKTINTI